MSRSARDNVFGRIHVVIAVLVDRDLDDLDAGPTTSQLGARGGLPRPSASESRAPCTSWCSKSSTRIPSEHPLYVPIRERYRSYDLRCELVVPDCWIRGAALDILWRGNPKYGCRQAVTAKAALRRAGFNPADAACLSRGSSSPSQAVSWSASPTVRGTSSWGSSTESPPWTSYLYTPSRIVSLTKPDIWLIPTVPCTELSLLVDQMMGLIPTKVISIVRAFGQLFLTSHMTCSPRLQSSQGVADVAQRPVSPTPRTARVTVGPPIDALVLFRVGFRPLFFFAAFFI